jgi:hypothetical protein
LAKVSIFELAGVKPTAPVAQATPMPVEAPLSTTPPVPAPRKKTSIFELADTIEAPAPEAPKLTNDDILKDPKRMKTVRDYMVKRKGDSYKRLPDDEVFDDYVDHMRWMNTNEVNTFGEARSVFDLKEEEKGVYRDAYNLYDELGNAYSAGGIGELGDAVANYTGAILTSPSSWIGGFVGRALSKPAVAVAKKGITTAVAGQVAEEVAKKGATETVKKTTIKAAAKAVEKKVAKTSGLVAAKKSRQELITAAIIATSVDAGISGGQEAIRQKSLMEVGAQDGYDYKSIALNTVFGVVGGGFSYFPEAMRNTVKLTDTGGKVKVANALRAKEAKKKVGGEIEESVKQLMTDWDIVAKQGKEQDVNLFLRNNAIKWFFDTENDKSFVRILQRLGADLGADDKTFSHKMVEYARGLPPQNRAAITKTLKPLGINFGEMIEIFAGTLKEGGENLSQASQAKRFFDDFKNVTVTKQQAINNTLEGEAEALELAKKTGKEAPSPQVLKYTASVWKRLLISHPSTTMLNVKGWGWAAAARTLSEVLHGGVLGSVGLAKKMAGIKSADKTLAKSAAMFKSNGLLVRSLLDPYTSVQGFTDLLESAPEKFKKDSLASFFGGIGDERPEMFNINPGNKAVKKIENAIDTAAKVAFVRTQDIYTKGFSGLKELDKLSRIELGKGVEDLLKAGETHLITEEMWEKTVRVLLEDTFSVNYTRGSGTFNQLAKMVETVSNAPGLGFIFPFGRFINNTMGFTYQYSPLAFLPLTKYQKGLDLEERLAKATVGTTGLVMLMGREEEKQAQGLQWSEEKTSTGDIKDVSGIFPMSLYNLMGRILADIKNGTGVPLALTDELVKQIGPLGALDDATSSNPITDMIREIAKVSETDEGASLTEIATLAGEMLLGTAAGIAAGFTRPLDPINDMIGFGLDVDGVVDDSTPDRKLAEGSDKILLNFSRYTNTFFNVLLGKDTGEGKKMFGTPKSSAIEDKPVKDPNPLSRLMGSPLKAPQDSIDILLGMADMAPFKMDSFTTGVPEYDNFINNTVFPILERRAEGLLASEFFMSRPAHIKRDNIIKILTESREDILEGLENGSLGSFEDYVFNERKKFIALPQSYRAEAKKAMGISGEDRELTLEEIERLKLWIDINKELDDELAEKL